MNDRPLRWGVVGVRYGAAVYIPGLQSEGHEVVAVCARHAETASETASRFGIAKVFTDYDEMLRSPDIDAIGIATPVPLHHEMSIAALRAGKHVLCEKPFALDTTQAREMCDAAAASGHTAIIGHEFRFASARMRAKQLIDEGYIGDMRLCLMRVLLTGGGRAGRPSEASSGPPAYVEDRDSAARGAGYLFGLGSHYIDCLRHWFGEIESVSARLHNFSPERMSEGGPVLADADDSIFATFEFATGGFAQLVASRGVQFGSGADAEVYGSKGTLVMPQRGVNPPAHGTLLGALAGDTALQPLEIPEELQPFADDRDDRLMPFRLLVREFARGVEEGRSPAPDFVDGLRCQQVLDAVRESSATGRRVAISPA